MVSQSILKARRPEDVLFCIWGLLASLNKGDAPLVDLPPCSFPTPWVGLRHFLNHLAPAMTKLLLQYNYNRGKSEPRAAIECFSWILLELPAASPAVNWGERACSLLFLSLFFSLPLSAVCPDPPAPRWDSPAWPWPRLEHSAEHDKGLKIFVCIMWTAWNVRTTKLKQLEISNNTYSSPELISF